MATDGDFYGVAYGGSAGFGALYRITPKGNYKVVYNFRDVGDGANPLYAPIQASDGSLYGITEGDIVNTQPTIYKYSAAGTVTTVFTLPADGSEGKFFGSPVLQADDSNLYVTTASGGRYDCGTILKVTTAGVLLGQYNFYCKQYGGLPNGRLIQAADGNLYGETFDGGYDSRHCYGGCGTIYRMTPDGTVTLIYEFKQTFWWDSAVPEGGLLQGTDGNLYGVSAAGGGQKPYGTIYMMSTGGAETILDYLDYSSREGHNPSNPFMQHTNGKFYSTMLDGGVHGAGTVYSLDMGLSPFITFVQPTGKVGGTAQILGQGFTGTSNVTFNGIPASRFFVNSDTSMTAVVPEGATSGRVVVVTPTGTLTSNVDYRISH